MPEDFIVEDMDEDVIERLRERAERNHRSLDDEVKVIFEEATRDPVEAPTDDAAEGGPR